MNSVSRLLRKINLKFDFFKMDDAEAVSEISKMLDPPNKVRKMKDWNPELFKKTISVSYLTLPEEKLNRIGKKFKENFFKIPNFKPIQNIENSNKKRLLLDPLKIRTFGDISEEDRKHLESTMGVGQPDFGQISVEMSVDNFRPQVMLRAVLPSEEVEGLSSYSHIGHIIHVNLKDELHPYKSVIGQILLRIPNVRMVVNKSSNIDNTFRNFEMEILARKSEEEIGSSKKKSENGDDKFGQINDFVVSVRENGAKFMFDFSKVYWNPRLVTEHQKVVDLLKVGDFLFDVFAGVGPFSVPAAMKAKVSKKCPLGIRVFANDLNPNSYDWLKHNFELNKVPKDQYSCFNKDGKDFIKEDVKQGLIEYFTSSETNRSVHITMNLPAIAVTFLHHFHGLLSDVDQTKFVSVEKKSLPVVHVYSFSKADDKEGDVRRNCEDQFGGKSLDELSVSFVRNVAPHKDMMRASFPLTIDILTEKIETENSKDVKNDAKESQNKDERCDEPDAKKAKIVQ